MEVIRFVYDGEIRTGTVVSEAGNLVLVTVHPTTRVITIRKDTILNESITAPTGKV